jgi:hypothetical protein
MAEFNIRSESVDVEQIMNRIRARIREKRGVDYTEDQIRELANVRLEKFLDPKNLRSDLLEQFRRSRPAIAVEPQAVEPPYTFSDETLFFSHRAPLRALRKLLQPILKLFFNPNTLNQVLLAQAQFNVDTINREQRRRIEFERSRSEWNALYYEVLHNLVLETTRNSIELKNMKMRLEAVASRLDFSERRVRALEGVVQYRPEAVRQRGGHGGRPDGGERDRRPMPRSAEAAGGGELEDAGVARPSPSDTPRGGALEPAATGDAVGRRRRRRRRGRRGAGPSAAIAGATISEDQSAGLSDEANGEAASDTEESFAESESMPAPVSFGDSRPTDADAPDVPHADGMEADDENRHGRVADLSGPGPERPPDPDEQ